MVEGVRDMAVKFFGGLEGSIINVMCECDERAGFNRNILLVILNDINF